MCPSRVREHTWVLPDNKISYFFDGNLVSGRCKKTISFLVLNTTISKYGGGERASRGKSVEDSFLSAKGALERKEENSRGGPEA